MELFPVVREIDVEHHVAVDDLAAVDGEAGLERLRVEERVRGRRLPERAKNIGIQPTRVARIRIDPVTAELPVVFCRRWDPVALVSATDLAGRFELTKRIVDGNELRVRANVGMKGCRDV